MAESADYERRERYAGSFARQIQVPRDVAQEEIEAVVTVWVVDGPLPWKETLATVLSLPSRRLEHEAA